MEIEKFCKDNNTTPEKVLESIMEIVKPIMPIIEYYENRTCESCSLLGKEECTLNMIRHAIPKGVSCSIHNKA